MFYSKQVAAAYERTIAILHEQLSSLQRQLDLSIAREAEARRDHAQMAAAVAFPPPPRFSSRETPRVRTPIPRNSTPWEELPLGDPNGSFGSADEASLLNEDETAALQRALGAEPQDE